MTKLLPLALLIAAGLLSSTASANAYTTYGNTVINGTTFNLSPGANLSYANLSGANLSGANLSNADLNNAVLYSTNLSGANLSNANLYLAYLGYDDLNNANLSGANLTGAFLAYANLTNANLTYANLTGANLTGPNLNGGAVLSNANLSNANLTNAYLNGAVLNDANLSNANLSYTNLSGANLSNANLTNANLTGANLSNAYLNFANLTNADLYQATLTNANLGSTNLTGANLIKANFSSANLSGANLTGALVSFSSWNDFATNSGATNLDAQYQDTIIYAGLWPQAYAGIADQGVMITRNFVRQTNGLRRRENASHNWDFDVGLSNDELTNNASSAYNSYAIKSDQVILNATRTIDKQFAITIAAGSNSGRVTAPNFNTNIKTKTVGVGLTYSPEPNMGRFDVAAAISSASWDSNRSGAQVFAKGQKSLSVGTRFTFAPIAKNNSVTLLPYVGITYSRSRVNGFNESGTAGSTLLVVDDFSEQSLQSEVGLNVDYKLSSQVTLTGLASWDHEFRSSGQTTLSYDFTQTGATDTRFTAKSKGFGADLYRIGLSLGYNTTPMSCLSLSYNIVDGKTVKTGHEIRANYSVRF
jgi:uncharacterized protein YjbI with pentapeptide repeats